MTKMYNPISVCITAYNEEKSIGRALESVVRQDYEGYIETLVCANNCNDNTELEVLYKNIDIQSRGITNRSIRLISITEKGKPSAWNTLRSAALNNYIFFADADVCIGEGALRYINNALEENPNLIAVGAMVVPFTGDSDFITRMMAYPSTPNQGSLVGRLYGFTNERLQKRMEEYGFDKMPKDLIHEDAWLTGLIGREMWKIEPKAVVYYKPYHFSEIPRLQLRGVRAYKQMKKDYPQIFEELFADNPYSNETSIEKTVRRLKKLRDTEGIDAKIGLVSRFLLYPLITFWAEMKVKNELLKTELDGWESSKHSKTSSIFI